MMNRRKRMKGLLIAVTTILLSHSWAVFTGAVEAKSISFKSSFEKDVYTYGEDIKIIYEITNTDAVPIQIVEPSILKQTVNMTINESASGKSYPVQVKWSGAWPLKRIELAPGKSLSQEDMTIYIPYPDGLKPGIYTIKTTYTNFGRDNAIESQPFEVHVEAPTGIYAPAYKTYREAITKYIQGDYERALELFRSLRADYPDFNISPRIQFYLARSLQLQGRYELAIAEYEKATMLYPKSRWATRANGDKQLLIRRVQRQKQYDQYLAARRDYAKDHKDEARAFSRAKKSGPRPQRIARLEGFVAKYPASFYAPQALAETGYLYAELGKQTEALAVMRNLITKYPDSYTAKRVAAELHWADLLGLEQD